MTNIPFYVALNEFDLGDTFSTKEKAISAATTDVADGAESRYVYEVRLVGKATKRVEFKEVEPDPTRAPPPIKRGGV